MRDVQNVLHPMTNLVDHASRGPLMTVRGEGIYAIEPDGRRLIEGVGGAWCLGLGYGVEELAKTAYDAMVNLAYTPTFFGRTTPPVAALAERLVDMVPFEASKVLFTSSGSEANDTQVRLLWHYNNLRGKPEKKKIISRRVAYHGSAGFASSLTALPVFHDDWDAPLDFVRYAGCPHHFRFAEPGESEDQFTSRLAFELESLIQAEDPDTIAAFIAEPVMCAGGVRIPPMSYFEKIQATLSNYDIRFIADEVICGFGRTGSRFGCETYGIRPDSMSIAKQLSSAYLPIAAVIVDDDMYETLVEGSKKHPILGHGFTYGGHPVAAAVALRTLELYDELDVYGHVQRVGPYFDERFQSLSANPIVGEVQTVGLLAAVELVQDQATGAAFGPEAGIGRYCLERCYDHGLIIRAIGDRICFCPPMVITEAEIDEMVDMLARALDDTWAWVEANRRELVART
jgi:4-aminobutyrate--pyruvate transaminase